MQSFTFACRHTCEWSPSAGAVCNADVTDSLRHSLPSSPASDTCDSLMKKTTTKVSVTMTTTTMTRGVAADEAVVDSRCHGDGGPSWLRSTSVVCLPKDFASREPRTTPNQRTRLNRFYLKHTSIQIRIHCMAR